MIYVWDLFGVEGDVKQSATSERRKTARSWRRASTDSDFMSCVCIMENLQTGRKNFSFNVCNTEINCITKSFRYFEVGFSTNMHSDVTVQYGKRFSDYSTFNYL